MSVVDDDDVDDDDILIYFSQYHTTVSVAGLRSRTDAGTR